MKSSAEGFFKKRGSELEKTDVCPEGNSFEENDPKKEINLRIVFLGESATGAKTSFVNRYVRDVFDECCKSTIGACFLTKSVDIKKKKVRLQMWDTAGQERFMSIEAMYYRGADGIVLGYDITNRGSLETLRERYAGLKKRCPDAVIMVIGNKVDRENEGYWGREVSYEEGDELANELGALLFFETSAKAGFNVNESMNALVEEILMTKGLLGDEMDDWVLITR